MRRWEPSPLRQDEALALAAELCAERGSGTESGYGLGVSRKLAEAAEGIRGQGRALAGEEIAKLFESCSTNTQKGARDAALLAMLHGRDLRRGESPRSTSPTNAKASSQSQNPTPGPTIQHLLAKPRVRPVRRVPTVYHGPVAPAGNSCALSSLF